MDNFDTYRLLPALVAKSYLPSGLFVPVLLIMVYFAFIFEFEPEVFRPAILERF